MQIEIMKGREHNHKKSTNGSKKRTTYEDLKRKSKGETCEFVAVPENAMGFVIGKKGNTIKQIQEKSGAKITQTASRSGFMVYGNEDQRVCAKELINKKLSSREGETSNQGGFRKLGIKIPEKFIGQVIGHGHEKLNTIETKTGVALKFIDNILYIKGSTEKEKKAVLQIKGIVNMAKKRSQSRVRVARFVHVDMAQLEENHEFGFSEQQRFTASSGEKCFKLKLLEHPLQEETSFDSAGIASLKEKVLQVLKQIHKEKDEDKVKVDMWCHLSHAYITEIDEDEEQKTFTAKDIKENVQSRGGKSWTPFFKAGLERMEVERIEKSLTSRAAKDDRRYDFTFYTPSCREVQVKTWLVEEHSLEKDTGACAPSLAFSRSPPVPVKNTLTRVLSEEHAQTGDASNTPCFHMCSEFHDRMKVDILILSKGLDCRLIIRTCPNVSKIPEDEEEDKILESYLMEMKIEGDQLVLPPVSERPDGFDLSFQRRSLRRTYQYEMEGEQFSLTVCKDQPINVDTEETDARNDDESRAMTDIHLHCEEWDRVLDEGNWEPEQIAAKLPTFLKFLRQVQRNVVPMEDYEENKI